MGARSGTHVALLNVWVIEGEWTVSLFLPQLKWLDVTLCKGCRTWITPRCGLSARQPIATYRRRVWCFKYMIIET